jgi:hypothetical protein
MRLSGKQFATLFNGTKKWRVVGSMGFSTLGIFRTCRDLRIGIERPQNETKKPRERPGTHVSRNRADGRKSEVR